MKINENHAVGDAKGETMVESTCDISEETSDTLPCTMPMKVSGGRHMQEVIW